MTQAPATTVATAVRQHGGGRHPLNLLCTAPAGRLQDSRGGVINRRAEGATSSHPLPAGCAAAAHPTTGVRRARELSPSLRSQNRPHAQLVEGYTPPLTQGTVQLRGYLNQLFQVLAEIPIRVSKQSKHASVSSFVDAELKGTNENREVESKFRRYCLALHIEIVVEIIGRSLHDSLKEVHVSLQYRETKDYLFRRAVHDVMQHRQGIALLIPPALKFLLLPHQLRVCLDRLPNNGEKTHGVPMVSHPRLSLLHPLGNLNSNDQRQNRAESLHPSRDMLSTPRHKQYQHRDRHNEKRTHQEAHHSFKREPYTELPIKHASLQALVFPSSLPALCHHVQRGAA